VASCTMIVDSISLYRAAAACEVAGLVTLVDAALWVVVQLVS